MSESTPAGWYPDPTMAETQRYWDGSAWSDHVAPLQPGTAIPASSAPQPPAATEGAVDPGALAPVDAQPAEQVGRRGGAGLATWGGRIARGLSIRVIFLSLIGGVAFGVLLNTLTHVPTMLVVWPVAALLWLVAVFNDGQMTSCDRCGKRVKLGYSTCHHCGYSRA